MTAPVASSFQRKTKAKLPSIPGVSPSIYSQHLISSTGTPDLDALLGGGLPIGTVLLIQEDDSGNFAKLLLKYFLAEGVVHGHNLHVASLNNDPLSIVNSLPSFEMKSPGGESWKANDEQMKIAWRYQNLPKDGDKEVGSKHSFNLLKSIPSDVISNCGVATSDSETLLDCDDKSTFTKLIQHLHETAKSGQFLIDPKERKEHKNILRIGVQSLGSVLWGDASNQIKQMSVFLLSLRALLRSCFGVAVITVPRYIFNNEVLSCRLLACSDYVVDLDSFCSNPSVHAVFKDYHGLLHIKKLPSLASLAPPHHLIRDPSQLVFKSKRTRFLIEKFHLPPDLSENVSRDQKDAKVKSNKSIEF